MSFVHLHAGSMIAAFLLMSVGAGIARYQRHRRWWLKAHKTAGITGSAAVLLGLAAAIIMVAQSGSGHIRVPHAGAGLITILLAIMTPALGQMQFTIREKAKVLGVRHRWCGRCTLIIGLPTILSGLWVAGIIG